VGLEPQEVDMTLGLDRPDFLWLLLLTPLFLWWARNSRRRIPQTRKIVALGLRLALFLSVVLALCELTLRRPVDELAVVFVMDRSASVGSDGEQSADAFVTASLAHAGKGDVSGMVVFGADALVEAEPRSAWSFHGVESRPNPHQSDLSAGLRLGTALLPADRTRRVVLLSDGEQTIGSAGAQAMQVAEDGMQVSVVPVGREPGPEAWLSDLIAPARVDQDAAYELRIVADSELPVSGTLRVYRNETYLGAMPVELQGGLAEVIGLRQEAQEPGLYRYRAVLEVDGEGQDTLPQNNTVVSTVQVAGRPKVLIAEGDPGQSAHLARVLREDGLEVVIVGPGRVPAGLPELRTYAAVILSDIPAYTLTRRQQEALRSFVRDLGRGLMMLGGDRSFGVGGYYNTPVEEALPVRMDLKDKTRFPKLAMVLAIDKSCSMGGGSGSKMALAREAAIRTADLLNDRDMLGVIGFDGAASWITPLQPLTEREQAIENISGLRPGGGTDIYPALKTAIAELDNSNAALKHVILLSDGMTTPGDYEPLITEAATRKTTLTTVAIGRDADSDVMRDFARWGGGNYYLVTEAHAIPAIFTREALLATRAFLIEEPFRAALGTPSEVTRGISVADIPTLGGYVATEPKRRAVVGMTVPDPNGDLPLLAHWRFGLGRSVAFTSDAKPRWAKAWIGQESYTAFWTQTVRWVVGDPDAPNVVVDSEIRDGALWVTVDAFDPMGGFLNFLDGTARVVAPDLGVTELDLKQVAPGRYQGTMPIDQDGSWLVGVALADGDRVVGQAVSEAVQPYSPEFRAKGGGDALLEEVARVGRGRVLTDPASVFARPEVVRQVPRPLWPPLIVLAGLLLLLDVAVRRLDLFGRRQGSAVLQRPAAAPPRWAFRSEAAPVPRGHRPTGAADDDDPDDDGPAGPPAAQVPEDSYAGRLLAARRKARRKLGGD
jgi:uncharacterized membrane protein